MKTSCVTFPPYPRAFSSVSCLHGGGAEQHTASAPGGGAGLWELHEQRTARECLRVQSLKSQQDS